MESQNLPCPKCPKICHSRAELISHLHSSQHRCTEDEIQQLMRASGWWEDKQPMPDGTEKALEHFNASQRAQAANAINIPFVPPPERKRQAQPPAGWQRTIEGYVYEKLISQVHTIDSIIKKVLKGSVIANHATLSMNIYKKDVRGLTELQDKERSLEAKLSSYVTADPEFAEIAEKLYETKSKIKERRQDADIDTETETPLEDWFSGDLGSDEHIEWQEKFMGKALLEAEQVQKQHAPKQEIKL